MNRSNAQITVHSCLLLLLLAGLWNVSLLSWTETLRLLLIEAGLSFLYIRYRELLVEDVQIRRGASVVLALVAAFVVTQFDPATASVHFQASPPRLNAYFVVSTILIATMGLVSVLAYPRTLAWSRSSTLDRIVLVTIGIAAVLSAGSRWILDEAVDSDFVLGVMKLLSYALIWIALTRVYGDNEWIPAGGSIPDVLKRQWLTPFVLLSALLIPAIFSGGYRRLAVIHYVGEGERHFQAEDWDLAERSYAAAADLNRVVDLGTARDRTLEDLAVLRLRSGKKGEAAPLIARLRSTTYDAAESDEKTGDVYLRSGDWSDAARYYQRVLDERGKDSGVIDRLGEAYLRMQDSRRFLELANTYGRVPHVEVVSFDQMIFLGNTHFYRSDFKEAAEYFRRGLQMKPRDAYAEYKVGRALLAGGDARAAKVQFENAIELEPDFADAYYRLGDSYEQLGEPVKARGFYQKTVDLLPNHLDGLMKLREGKGKGG